MLKNRNKSIKFIATFLLSAVMLISLMIASYFYCLWYTFIDETVISGQAYGFVIGDSKSETYIKARGSLAKLQGQATAIYIEIKSDANSARLLTAEPGYTLMIKALLHDVGYPAFESKNRWDFYIDGSYFNSLTLKFCDEKLCEIYRHRKYFELP